MSTSSIPAEALLLWNDTSAKQWLRLLTEQPAILQLPCDVRNSGTVARVFQHIFAVELRYAQRLAELPQSSYDDIPFEGPQELQETHDHALQLVRNLLDDPAFDWNLEIEFQTISAGKLRATRQAALIHLLMHGIRHYAQLATLLRQHDIRADWMMDYLGVASQPVA